jgi:alkanesulfonate monooxygenase SsuD/methylene tetrahydromethanopterin reductase-like flavin-dependent oxidoreductase (luciferase family)
MSGGRACAGFARGYQRRWVDTMAQQNHGIHGALPHEHDAIDDANRAAFEESYRLIKQAWAEDLTRFEGRFWRVPAGPTPWELEATRRYGAGVADGVVQRLGIVPKPLQRPHPPIFQPFASSERSIRWCAEEGITAVLPPLHPRLEQELVELYAEVSQRAPGDGIGVLRDVIVAESDEQALQLWLDSGLFCGQAWFEPFGFNKGLADPSSGEMADLFENALVLVGSVETVCRRLESLCERLPVRHLFAWTYNGLIPHARVLHSLETFAERVLPRFAAG